jgi:hypothetical protein
MWARTANPNQGQFNGLFSTRPSGGGTTDTFQIDTDGAGTYRFFTSGGSLLTELDFGPVANDAWQHLVATVDGAQLTLFVDGAQTNAGTLGAGQAERFRAFVAGANRNDSAFYDGLIDDVQFYNKALTPVQVTFLHEHPGQLLPEPGSAVLLGLCGLLLLWRGPTRASR